MSHTDKLIETLKDCIYYPAKALLAVGLTALAIYLTYKLGVFLMDTMIKIHTAWVRGSEWTKAIDANLKKMRDSHYRELRNYQDVRETQEEIIKVLKKLKKDLELIKKETGIKDQEVIKKAVNDFVQDQPSN